MKSLFEAFFEKNKEWIVSEIQKEIDDMNERAAFIRKALENCESDDEELELIPFDDDEDIKKVELVLQEIEMENEKKRKRRDETIKKEIPTKVRKFVGSKADVIEIMKEVKDCMTKDCNVKDVNMTLSTAVQERIQEILDIYIPKYEKMKRDLENERAEFEKAFKEKEENLKLERKQIDELEDLLNKLNTFIARKQKQFKEAANK